MKTTTSLVAPEHPIGPAMFPVYCTACSRRCLLYTNTVHTAPPEDYLITNEKLRELGVTTTCPLRDM